MIMIVGDGIFFCLCGVVYIAKQGQSVTLIMMMISSLVFNFKQQKAKAEVQEIPRTQSIFFDDAQDIILASLLDRNPGTGNFTFITVPGPYVAQIPSIEMANSTMEMVYLLHRYERRMDRKHTKRRIVRGAKETLRHLRRGHLKLVIIAMDLDTLAIMEGTWRAVVRAAREMSVPIIYSCTRMDLNLALDKPCFAENSIIGILNADGAHQLLQKIVELSFESSRNWLAIAQKVSLDAQPFILHLLVYWGHYSLVEQLLNNQQISLTINKPRNSDGATPILLAAANGDTEIVVQLIACGADLSLRNFSLQGIMHAAVLGRNPQCLDLVIGKVKNLQPATIRQLMGFEASGNTPLDLAVAIGDAEIVELLGLAFPDQLTLNLLEKAASIENCDSRIISFIVSKLSIDDSCQETLLKILTILCKNGSIENLRIVLALIRKSLKSNQRVAQLLDTALDPDGRTMAWWAAYLGHVGIVRELERSGASLQVSVTLDSKHLSIQMLCKKWANAAKTLVSNAS